MPTFISTYLVSLAPEQVLEWSVQATDVKGSQFTS